MVKVGIIGSGFGLYGLLPAFHSTKNCQVVAICGEKTDRLLTYCQSIGLKNIYTDWQHMIQQEKLDAIAIAVTPNAQYTIAKKAIEKGLHIFAEKPLAATLPQAKELFLLAKKKKIIHAVDFMFPEIDKWQKVKGLLDKNIFGKLQHISVNWDFLSYDIKQKKSSWKTNATEGGGALSFYFSHGLYYLEYFAGKIKKIASTFSYAPESLQGGEVGVDLLLTFATGIHAYAHISCNTKGIHKHQIIFQCEKGTIILENKNSVVGNFTITTYNAKRKKSMQTSRNSKTGNNEDERVQVVKKLTTRFINACRTNTQMTPSFAEGIRVQELIDSIRKKQL